MSRWPVLVLGISALLGSKAHSAEPADRAFAPIYDGPHIVPSVRLAGLPPNVEWSQAFWSDTNAVLALYEWYLAEITCIVDESGQVRDTFLTDSVPSRNLSAATVDELRHKKVIPTLAPGGPVPGRFAFRLKYILQGYTKSLGTVAARLRTAADKGDANSQYLLSRLLLANVSFRRGDLDGDMLLQRAANGGSPRAMLELGLLNAERSASTEPAAALAEKRRWQLEAAQAGSGVAELLVALDSWAERTDPGYARARHWLERAKKQDEAGSGKYLAALLVSHSTDAGDWKQARKLADAASRDWHDRHDPDTWQILAAAAALNGDFKAAIEAQTKAAAFAEKNGWARPSIETRLSAYRASRTVTDEIVGIPAVARVVLPAPASDADSVR